MLCPQLYSNNITKIIRPNKDDNHAAKTPHTDSIAAVASATTSTNTQTQAQHSEAMRKRVQAMRKRVQDALAFCEGDKSDHAKVPSAPIGIEASTSAASAASPVPDAAASTATTATPAASASSVVSKSQASTPELLLALGVKLLEPG